VPVAVCPPAPVGEWDLGDAPDTTIGGLAGYVGIGRQPRPGRYRYG
jgi:hypothetical protein